MAHSAEHIAKHKKVYITVGIVLLVGTIITVAAANVHLGIILGITVAVLIATVKGSLVAGYFMHLFSERRLIYVILAFTAVFVLAMVGLIMLEHHDQQGRQLGAFPVAPQRVTPHHGAETHQGGAAEEPHVP